MHPPRDVKQLLHPVGAERGAFEWNEGLRRVSRDDKWLQQPRVPHQHHEPGQHQGSKPTTLCRVRLGLMSGPLHLYGVRWSLIQNP